MKYLCIALTIIVCFCLFITSITPIAWTDGHIQIKEKEKKIILKGTISKALGEFDDTLKGAIEYLACGPTGKLYESILETEASATEVHKAIAKLGIKTGTPPGFDDEKNAHVPPTGTTFLLSIEWKENGKTKKIRAEELVYNVKTKKPMPPVAWIYSGSRVIPDLDSDDEDAMIPYAYMSNHIVALKQTDGSALFQNPLPESVEENLYKKNDDLLPKLGTPVTFTIEENRKMQLYVLISGKVQGVGFRNFTRSNARQIGVNGYAKNLANGKVEVVAEGDKLHLNQLIDKIRQGPRASRVDDVKIEEREFNGEYKSFDVRF